MESRSRDLRLRLAARTLIEWNTPRTNSDYQRVLEDLLQRHHFARTLGFKSDSPILKLDERESVLWYLSDSFEADVEAPRFNFERARMHLMEACEPALVWCGISSSRVASAVWEAVQSDIPQRRSLGYRALIAMSVPLPEYLARTRWEAGVFAGLLGRFRRVARFYVNAEALSPIAVMRHMSVRYMVLTKYVVRPGDVVVTTAEHFSKVTKVKVERRISRMDLPPPPPRFLMRTDTILVLLLIAMRGIVDVLTFPLATVSGLGRTEILGLLGKPLLFLRAQKRSRPAWSRLSPDLLLEATSRLAGSEPGVLSALLRKSPEFWAPFALAVTRVASENVIKELLRDLRSPELSSDAKAAAFAWLCRVRLPKEPGRSKRRS